MLNNSSKVQKGKNASRSHFGNLGAGVEWLNLGSLQTPQGHRGPPEAPAELHCTGAREASMGPEDSSAHLAAEEDEVEEEEEEEAEGEEAEEVRRDSWLRRSWPGPEMRGHPPVSSSRGTGPVFTPIPTLTSPSRRRISCSEEPRSRM